MGSYLSTKAVQDQSSAFIQSPRFKTKQEIRSSYKKDLANSRLINDFQDYHSKLHTEAVELIQGKSDSKNTPKTPKTPYTTEEVPNLYECWYMADVLGEMIIEQFTKVNTLTQTTARSQLLPNESQSKPSKKMIVSGDAILKEQLKRLNEEFQALQLQKNAAVQRCIELEQKLKESHHSANGTGKIQKDMELMKEEKQKLEEINVQQQQEFEERVRVLQSSVKEVSQSLSESNNENAQLKLRTAELESLLEVHDASKKKEDVRMEDERSQSKETYEEEKHEIERQQSLLASENHSLKTRIEELNQHLQQRLKQSRETAKDNSTGEFQNELSSRNQAIQMQSESITSLKCENEALQDQVKGLKQDRLNNEIVIRRLTAEISQLRQQSTNFSEDLREFKRLFEVQERNNREQLEKLQMEKEEVISKLHQQIEELENPEREE